MGDPFDSAESSFGFGLNGTEKTAIPGAWQPPDGTDERCDQDPEFRPLVRRWGGGLMKPGPQQRIARHGSIADDRRQQVLVMIAKGGQKMQFTRDHTFLRNAVACIFGDKLDKRLSDRLLARE